MYWSTFGAPCQYVSFLLRMTWSPLRHSTNLNWPLNTVGWVFSGALSISSFDESCTYFPNICVGSGLMLRSLIAGQLTLVNVIENFFGFELSALKPGIVVAFPSEQSLKPTTSWKFDLRTVFLLLPYRSGAVSTSSAMIGLPSDQFAFALIS